MKPTFEWNAKKAKPPQARVDFEEAKSVFLVPLSIAVADPAQTVAETASSILALQRKDEFWSSYTPNEVPTSALSVAARQHQWKHELMNKDISEEIVVENDDMLPEYDFTGGVSGKHYKAMRKGHTVKIDQADGTTLIQHFKLEEGTALLDPDVRKYFPTRRQ